MEPEGSLQHSQVPATCPCPEPVPSSPHPTSHFLKIHRIIILPSTSGSPKWSLSLRFPHQNPVYASPLPHTRYMPRPSNSSRFYHPSSLGWEVQIFSPSLCSFLHSPVTSFLLGPNILLSALFSNTVTWLTSPNVSDQVSHPYKTTGKVIVVYTLIFKFLDSKLEDKIFRIEWYQTFPDFNLQLISSWIEFWFFKVVPKYLKSSTFSNELLSICILWPAQQTSYWEADSSLIEKLPAFYGILIFITVYTRKYSTRFPSTLFL